MDMPVIKDQDSPMVFYPEEKVSLFVQTSLNILPIEPDSLILHMRINRFYY